MPRTAYTDFVKDLNKSASDKKRCAKVKNRDKPRDPLMEIVRGRMITAKISCQDIAEYCGVGVSTVYLWLNQSSADIPPKKMMRLCTAVGVSEEEYRQNVLCVS